jgi:outer membrane receptor protein involved in Fe transport
MPICFGRWVMAALSVCLLSSSVALSDEPTTHEDDLPPPMPMLIPASQPAEQIQPLIAPAPATPPPATRPAQSSQQLTRIVVTSNLDSARDQIAPSLGAVTYTIGQDQIDNIPQGDNAAFQQVLLRMPGVVADSFGQEHVRGEHANTTYRVNGVILPEPLNGFGQELDTHLIDSVTLIDGTLPAQFGFRTAGIIDVTTKTGQALNSNELSIYGGSYDTFQPSYEVGGHSGQWDYFFAGSYKHSDLGIENPAPTRYALHDSTDQSRFFGYLSDILDDTSRLTFMLNASYGTFQIPNTANVPQVFPLAGVGTVDSATVNENQSEQTYYGVVSYQKSTDEGSFQVSAFSQYAQIHYTPDPIGDLVFLGVASDILNGYATSGIQFDSSYNLDDQHTLRAGVIASYTGESLETSNSVFDVDPNTGAISDVPTEIDDSTRNRATSAGVYVQDEWKLASDLTLNYGGRFDVFDANFDNESQFSPRVNLVWKVSPQTTAHIGYARYFVPPPVQYVPPSTIAKFANTTNAPSNFIDDPPKVERSNYYDAGFSTQLTKQWLVNVDGFYKQADQLVDLGQFGQALILSPFNYEKGFDYGPEVSTTYKMDKVSAFGNFAWVQTGGRNIDSQQFLIDSDELAYIQDHYIKLDHESAYTMSAGVSYDFSHDDSAYIDALYGSGLRSGFANLDHTKPYYPVSLGYQHVFRVSGGDSQTVTARIDVVNIFDQVYQLRDGSGIGVGAPQYGQRRGVYVGLAYDF